MLKIHANHTKGDFIKICLVAGLFLLPLSASAQFLFQDVTDQAGIYMVGVGSNEAGSGVVVGDLNNDGWDDFYLPGGQDSDKIFINMHDGTFKDVTPPNVSMHLNHYGQQDRTYPRGGIILDYDNDGLPDIYVVTENEDILWHNDGNFQFTNATDAAHLKIELDQNESMSATFGDFKGDGYNDIYVARWFDGNCAFTQPDSFGSVYKGYCEGFRNWLYVNNHDGTFSEQAEKYQVDCDTTKVTNIVIFFDYDRDGDLDLIIGNDNGVWMQPNRIFRNMLMETGSAVFQDATTETGLSCHMSCMGIAPCDYNRDGNFDFYETSFGSDSLMANDGSSHFTCVTKSVLPPHNGFDRNGTYMTTGWTTLIGDFDNDGWEDAFVVHGALDPLVSLGPNEVTNPNKQDTSFFYHNVGGKFYDVTDQALGGKYLFTRGRGAARLDYNHDGKLDILYGAVAKDAYKVSSFRLLENISKPSENVQHWLEMNFTAKRTAKEAIGTIVDVWAGGIVHSRQVCTGGGFGSQSSLTQHVGLGDYGTADSIIVFWPADQYTHRQIDKYYHVKADTILHFIEKLTEDVPQSGIAHNTELKLFPSPATSFLNIISSPSTAPKHFEIYDLMGRKQMDIWNSEINFSVPIAGLRPGCYALRATINGSTEIKQFIKE